MFSFNLISETKPKRGRRVWLISLLPLAEYLEPIRCQNPLTADIKMFCERYQWNDPRPPPEQKEFKAYINPHINAYYSL